MAQVPVVEREDHRKAIAVAILMFFITLFILFFIKYHEPDPPKVTIPIPITMADEGIDEFEVYNAGGGAPSETVTPSVTSDVSPQEQPTQQESPVTVTSGQGTSQNTATTPAEEPSSPFSGTGSGGQGTAGSGGGFGSDTGPGSGTGEPGTGAAGDRTRLTNVSSKPKTPNSTVCKIAFKLTVDSRGYVVSASVIRAETTTTNQALIDEVTELVKKEVKYAPIEGARNQTAFYTVTVQPG